MRTQPHRETWLVHPPRASVPPRLRPWLTDSASLTARVRARCGVFSLVVLAQRLALPHADESSLLGLRRGEIAWVREVLLVADGVPVVFARSILPRHARGGSWTLFHGIGARPLGAALFADPAIRRGPLACRRLDRRDARYHRILRATPAGPRDDRHGALPDGLPGAVWARRSLFRLGRRVLLVSEMFLPTIFELPT